MKALKNHPLVGSLLFFILGAWLVSTLFIDFFAVIAVFRNISSIFEAGTVGMYIFNSFNKFEFSFAIILLIFSFYYVHPKGKIALTVKVLAIMLLGIAGYYLFFLSPIISELTREMYKIGVGNNGYETLQQTHQVFHKRYVRLDSVKIVVLIVEITLLTLTTLKVNRKVEEENLS